MCRYALFRIPQLRKLQLNYSPKGGSSKGVRYVPCGERFVCVCVCVAMLHPTTRMDPWRVRSLTVRPSLVFHAPRLTSPAIMLLKRPMYLHCIPCSDDTNSMYHVLILSVHGPWPVCMLPYRKFMADELLQFAAARPETVIEARPISDNRHPYFRAEYCTSLCWLVYVFHLHTQEAMDIRLVRCDVCK